MAKEGWAVPFVVAKGVPLTFAYYALERDREPNEFMEECARHAVAMKTLERLYCPGANDPRWEQSKHLGGIYPNMGRLGAGTGTPGYACEWHLGSSTRGTFETTFREAASTAREPSVGLRSHRCWSPQRPICIVADVLDGSRAGRAAWNGVHGEG